jgi:S-adenosylmethionine:tRNA ribosyltransferase-isomerase
MRIEDFKYTLKEHNITPEPREIRLGRRDLGRMIVIDRSLRQQIDSHVLQIPDYFESGDVLILNNSKRVPGILKGNIEHNGAQVELQFIGLGPGESAMCRIYPMHYITESTIITFGQDKLTVTGRDLFINKLCKVTAYEDSLINILKRHGFAINAFFSSKAWDVDYMNPYYSTKEGAIESPLAGLHFTPELINTLQNKGVGIGYITLHSVGSWLPFLEDDIEDHNVFEEELELPEETAALINRTKKNGKKVVACGSTVIRTIESCADENGLVTPQIGHTSLYIRPGYHFRTVDRYFTNFHQYKTSLMILDAAFCGYELLMETIEVAKEREYLFYEYGDAVFYI